MICKSGGFRRETDRLKDDIVCYGGTDPKTSRLIALALKLKRPNNVCTRRTPTVKRSLFHALRFRRMELANRVLQQKEYS
ncbi:hypothetical protein PILCRDRAFT_814292 [Piloderma croceum F 1598]|uniref:Uncharacterized protein n=1 Tax=Piloderma croceum (strain F 1598) TaxID=765440 RepID=A0A0C3BPH3_PILCF|nr:hypothetical protein PILCRDRAFT_814292 [Piloderma croceum F 1598]